MLEYVSTSLSKNFDFNFIEVEKRTYPTFVDNGENRVLIFGSSQVALLNVLQIERYLSDNGIKSNVYNLAYDGDRPTERLLSIDQIVAAKPKLVVYGLGFRDFEPPGWNDKIIGQDYSEKPTSPLPDPQKILQENLLDPSFASLNLGSTVFRNPQYLTLKSLDILSGVKQFPVPDAILNTVWQSRPDLQKVFPEVKNGNMENLKKWATEFGWNETVRLYPLTPPGKIPSYIAKNGSDIGTPKSALIINREKNPFFNYYDDMRLHVQNNSQLEAEAKNPVSRFREFDSVYKDHNIQALEELISSLHKNNIKVVFFTTPYPKAYLDTVTDSGKNEFLSIFTKIDSEYGVKTYFLYDKYKDLNIWSDIIHASNNESASIYPHDIAEIIQNETGN